MARKQKLKVYRTPIGFHDAFVAAPSQRVALKAWGSDADLFARGIAEVVTDEALTKEPLARPGEVIKRSRGTADEQLAALPADRPKARRAGATRAEPKGKSKTRSRGGADARTTAATKPTSPKPRPSREALDHAEAELADLMTRQKAAEAELVRREEALQKERRDLDRVQARDRKRAEAAIEKARETHSEALDLWISSRES